MHTQQNFSQLERKNEIVKFSEKLMGLESTILTEVTPAWKDDYQMLSLLCQFQL